MNDESLKGVPFYKAGALLVYFLLGGIPLGLIFYGVNAQRRGARIWGGVLFLFGAVMLAGVALLAMGGESIDALRAAGLVAGVFVYVTERSQVSRAFAAGAVPARWWPPLTLLLLYMIAVGIGAEVWFPQP